MQIRRLGLRRSKKKFPARWKKLQVEIEESIELLSRYKFFNVPCIGMEFKTINKNRLQ